MSVCYTAADVAQWCGGEVVSGSPDTELLGLAIDTREVTPGCLFAAIVGPNHDAHKFLAQAKDAGASGLLVQTGSDVDLTAFADIAVIGVADTTKGIGDLATGHRGRFAGTVIALTGSCGKTTTKEMISAVLETAGPCLKTQGNLNNNFGVPLTLLSRRPEDIRAVVEMGMNHRGEIAVLANMGLPDIGLVTNVGTAHIEYLGSQEEIAAEKGDLFAALGTGGTAVANWDDPHVRAQSDRAAGRVISFGVNPDADVRAENARFEEDGAYHFTLLTPKGEAQVRIKALGDTTVQTLDNLQALVGGSGVGETGVDELRQISDLVVAQGYETDRIMLDPSVVRGLGYYTGPVYEAELTFKIKDEKGRLRQFGSVAGGGRYDDLVKRFTGQEVPATGISIGVDRLLAALRMKGRVGQTAPGPVVITVMDRDRMSDYQSMAAELRAAGIRAEVYLGNPKNFGNQLKYADKRKSPIAIIEGDVEKAAGIVQIKDLILGAELAKKASLEEWKARPSQIESPRAELIEQVRKMLLAQALSK